MTIIQVHTPSELRGELIKLRAAGRSIGFVPTMGALHEGHIELGRAAKKSCDIVVYSIFVNPLQFAPHEDYTRYPRKIEEDVARLQAGGADIVYLPGVNEMYPPDFTTRVRVDGISEPLEGKFRPAFFDGVATVVTKLLMQVMPDQAFFGEKDYQQLQVIKRLAHDLNFPIEIVGVPTVRDDNGLALSSRNTYLTPEQYLVACNLNGVLLGLGELVRRKQDLAHIEAIATKSLLDFGFTKVDYVSIRNALTLNAPQPGDPLRVLAAAWIGTTRLIDNMPV